MLSVCWCALAVAQGLPERIEPTENQTKPVETASALTEADARISMIAAAPNLLEAEDLYFDNEELGFFGAEPTRLFFDDHEAVDLAYRNAIMGHLKLQAPDGPLGIETEIVLSGLVQLERGGNLGLYNRSSYLKLSRNIGSSKLILTVFPDEADPIRLGYSHGISWGSFHAPGGRLSFTFPHGYAFVAGKSTVGRIHKEDGTIDAGAHWGVLAGGGWRGLEVIQVDATVGYFDRGHLDKEQLRTVADGYPPWTAYGGSIRLAHCRGQTVPMPVDFELWHNEPFHTDGFFATRPTSSGFSYTIETEVNALFQGLQDPGHPKNMTTQRAMAGDASARFALGNTRFGGLFVWRETTFIVRDVPSLLPFVDLPDNMELEPELFGALFLAHEFPLGLAPSLEGGVRRPSYVSAGTRSSGATVGFEQLIVYDPTRFQPTSSKDIELQVEVKGALMWRLSRWVVAALELMWLHNGNARVLGQDPYGVPTYLKADADRFAFNLLVRGRIP